MSALTQTKKRALYRNLAFGGLALAAAIAVTARLTGLPMHWPATIVVVASVVIALLQFNTLDETAKQAHYIAWYWGSLVALTLLMGVGVALAVGVLPFSAIEALTARALGAATPRNLFLFGVIAAPGVMFLAFGVWWSAHWLRLGSER